MKIQTVNGRPTRFRTNIFGQLILQVEDCHFIYGSDIWDSGYETYWRDARMTDLLSLERNCEKTNPTTPQ